MKNGRSGLGSALAVLIFSTLCLILFATSTFSTAATDRVLSVAAARMVRSYYEADTLAECILADILESETVPDIVRETPIFVDEENGAVSFCCSISDTNKLYVNVLLSEGECRILQWRIQQIGGWEADMSLPVWSGE